VTVIALVERLRELGIRIALDEGRLRVNAPRGAITPELKADLEAHRDDLIRFLEHARGAHRSLPLLGPAGTDPSRQPLSFTQERFLFIQQLDPSSTAYSTPGVVRLRGPLDVDTLCRAWDASVRRHDIVRTVFRYVDGQAIGIVALPAPAIDLIDLTTLAPDVREREALILAQQELARPFDLENGPVVRAQLLRLDPSHHVLVANAHHIVSDQWSQAAMLREIATHYNAIQDGVQDDVPDLALQYADFAAWQRRYWAEGGWQEQLSYWRQHLTGARVVDLPSDRPRPAVQSTEGAMLHSSLPAALLQAVKPMAVRAAVSPSMVFLTGFYALVHRYTGLDDIVIGQPIAGRRLAAIEPLLGPFVNTLALRVDLSGRPTFAELLERVKDVALGAYSHQEFPFERLIAELSPVRDTSHAPLVQVMFNFVNAPMHGMELRGLRWEPLPIDRGAAQFDLSLIVDPTVSSRCMLEYNTAIFDTARMRRMLDEYLRLMVAGLGDPSARVSDLPMLSPDDRRAMVYGWNETRRAYDPRLTVSQRFEAQAAATPEALAVVSDGRQLTYGELNRRANQLARHLRGLGAGPGTLVGIGIERSVDLLVSALGVLKSGAAYVPLDPAFPTQRLAHMIEDSGLRLLVTQSSLEADWPVEGLTLVKIDGDQAVVAAQDPGDPDPGVTAADRAYVIYTSGSTGKPKGVEVPHGALVNFLESMQERPGFDSTDVMLAVTTLSFDIAGLELYVPLLSGGTVVIATREEAGDAETLAGLMAAHGVTVLQATPATFRLLIDADWAGASQLRALCGGEAMPPELAAALLPKVASLWNMYGPTETTIWSTVDQVTSTDEITIGRPIANTQVYVLDRDMQPTPIGVPGELYIGGDGVARGYLGRPSLTAERFVPDPFTAVAGGRLYRTGDLARFLEDGRLECLGRVDHQVKVRGFRIELGEIESALLAMPEVKEAVVFVREDRAGDKRLVAYVVFQPGADLTPSDIRRVLKQTLPDYMVPSFVVSIERIPLTDNGKVDRRALPDPLAAGAGIRENRVAPRTPMERSIAALWAEAIGHNDIATTDNFFEIGGHSLLAMQVLGRIQSALGVRLGPRILIMDSLEQVAARCEQNRPGYAAAGPR
jgi:amino acid adenylation domain-containing protein